MFEDKITSAPLDFDSSQINSAFDREIDTKRMPIGREKWRKKLEESPNLVDCLILCYLGIITLRLPVTPGDFYAWTTDGKLAFRRAIKHLPSAIRDRLPAEFHASLAPDSLLNLEIFFLKLTNLEMAFEKEFGILWPPLNVPLLLFRYLKELALPLEIYSATISLGNLLGFDFALHTEVSSNSLVRHIPEAQLASCLVVCVKLFFPFEGERRFPKSRSEPAAVSLEWSNWCTIIDDAHLTRREDTSKCSMEELTNLQEKDVFAMTEDQMDQYLDFYLDNFIDKAQVEANTANDDFQDAIFRMFPVTAAEKPVRNEPSNSEESEKLMEAVRAVQGRMKPNPVVVEDEDGREILRPGQNYVMFAKESSLPEHAGVFFREVARVVGLSLDMLCKAVFSTEMRVEKRVKAQRRQRKKAS